MPIVRIRIFILRLITPFLALMFGQMENMCMASVDPIACGKACLAKHQYKRAEADFKNAVQKSPKSCEGHFLLGQVYCKMKDYSQAKQQLRLAIQYGHGSSNAQNANTALMQLPPAILAPKTGPETKSLAPLLDLPATTGGATKPTVIDFYATWCNPCQQLHTVLEKARTEYGDKVNFVRVDVDDQNNRKLVDQYEVSPIPTVVYLNGQGEVVTFSIGYSGESTVSEALKKIAPSLN